MTKESLQAAASMVEADNALALHEFERAIARYSDAILFAESAPADDPLFVKDVLMAHCHAGLSSAFGATGKFVESVASANTMMDIFRKFSGQSHLMDIQEYLMAAISKTSSLLRLGDKEEAILALREAERLYLGSGTTQKQIYDILTGIACELEVPSGFTH